MLPLIPESEDGNQKVVEVFKDYISNFVPFYGSDEPDIQDREDLLKQWVDFGEVSFTVPEEFDGLSKLPPKWAKFVRGKRKSG
jgi:hypothetical protein